MVTRQEACCGRFQSALVHEEGELKRLARMASNRQLRGLDLTQILADIATTKAQIAHIKANIDAHDADHSGEMC